ncbi:MAG: hypothetical protein IAE95_05275 [Chitinophagaceae bacterium]|nr:hypothetical protein [Chitinophagaceae bacterium]
MKITPRPVTASDRVDQSRDISGMNKWAQSSRTVGFIMLVLGWFTIPAEVFLRRDFGQRWFTVVNFYAGLFLMFIFATLQYVLVAIWGGIHDFVSRVASAINPFHTEDEITFTDQVMDRSMLFLLIAYLVLGSYHLFKIWWRNRSNTALHSFDDGTSRCERLAGLVIGLINALAKPFVALYFRMLPATQRIGITKPKLINDRTVFTNTAFEPLLVLLLAFWFQGIASIWLFFTAVAVAIHANWKETARLSKVLDFRDSIIEAKAMMHLKDETMQASTSGRVMQQAAETVKSNPEVAAQVIQQYPDLMSIIDEMNRDGSHLAN